MNVSEMMKTEFLKLDFDDTLAYAAKKLADANLSEAPVLREGRYAGTFTTSDVAAALVKKYLFGRVQKADAQKVRSEKVGAHMKKLQPSLDPDSDMVSALVALLHGNADSIPVVKDGTVIGIVLASDIRAKMAKILSSAGPLPAADYRPEVESTEGKTAIDRILHYVQQKGSASAKEAAGEFGLSAGEVEEYALCLEKHGLLRIEYGFFGAMVMKKPE